MRQSKFFVMAAALAAVFVMASSAVAMVDPINCDLCQTAAQEYPLYVITGGLSPVGGTFTATKNGGTMPISTNQQIQTVINAIITDARQSFVGPTPIPQPFGTIEIQFGNGSDAADVGSVLDISGQMVSFDGGGSSTGTIILSGKITSGMGPSSADAPSGTMVIGRGITVESSADIRNVAAGGNAIGVDGGQVKIIGGTVAVTNANGGNAIDISFNSRDGGLVILGGSPTITGNINVRAGALSVAADPAFAPAGKQYTLTGIGAAGSVAVVGGASFISNFTLVSSGNLALKASGDDLVLYDPTTSVITKNPVSAKPFGISMDGASLRLVGTSQATPIRIYNLNGKLLMSRSAMPNELISVSYLARGTYVVKALGNSVRIVR
jgi:hypothetical protein